MSECLLNLIVSPQVEDSLVEWLLARDDLPGFSSMPVFGHGSSEHSMTLAEQVTGRTKRVMFVLHVSADTARIVLDDLRAAFSGSGLHYWVAPILEFGRLD